MKLAGWVHNYRDHGKLVLVDLRDRDGLTQIVFDVDECGPGVHDEARRLRGEWVVSVEGTVAGRGLDEKGKSRENLKLATGKVEVRVKRLHVLSESPTPPFTPDEHETVNEEKRLAYRYLDLRRHEMQETLRTRYPRDQDDARLPRRAGFLGDRDAVPDQEHARRRARFHRAVPAHAGQLLRAAAIAAVVQAAPDGERLRQVHADRPLLPR